jgi:CO dehydrogenase/acetyl-CoA synthase complex epsilon subunit
MACEPWQCGELGGTKRANSITKPEIAVAMIKKATHPIMIVGAHSLERDLEGKKLIDYLVDFARCSKVPVVATAHIAGEFLKRGYTPATWMSAMDIGNRLTDTSWKGIDGKGPHDLALFVSFPYYMEGNILSGLLNFAPQLKTMTLDNVYHPNASWSFPNGSAKDWANNLKVMTLKFEERGQ